jgi:hypothetical protein
VFAWRRGLFSGRAWRVAGVLVAVHVLLLSLVGGAMLERYLLPVLPIVYTAMAAATGIFRPVYNIALRLALLAGLIAGNFWNPPYPFPFENNLAFTDFVQLQRSAASFLEHTYATARIATAWPLTAALSRPELGYVSHPLSVHSLPDFTAYTIDRLDWYDAPIVVVFSRAWEPEWSWTNFALVRRIWHTFYGYEPELSIPAMRHRAVTPLAHWYRRGLWLEIYAAGSGTVLARRPRTLTTRPTTPVPTVAAQTVPGYAGHKQGVPSGAQHPVY